MHRTKRPRRFKKEKKYCILTTPFKSQKILSLENIPTIPKLEYVTNIDEWDRKWEHTPVTWKLERGTEDIPGNYIESRIIALSFFAWQKEIKDIRFRRMRGDETPDCRIRFLSSNEDSLFKERPGVLAYAYFPGQGSVSGDVTFNDDYLWSSNGEPIEAWKIDPDHYDEDDLTKFRTYNLQQTATHEIGHGIALVHSPDCRDCVMYPYYNARHWLNDLDKERIKSFYGSRTFSQRMYNLLVRYVKRGYHGR